MKTLKYKLLAITAFIVCCPGLAMSKRYSKDIHKSYPLKSVKELHISNKFGNIYIGDSNTDSVTIDVNLWIEHISEDKAMDLLDEINITINITGNKVSASTSFEPRFKTSKNFSIDYKISIPADRHLSASQKYGNITMNNLTGEGEFNIQYGNLTANKLLSPKLKINIAYSKCNIEEVIDLDAEFKYSKLYLERSNNIQMNSKYSTINAKICNTLDIESKYDHIFLGTVNSVKSESMYTTTKIKNLLNTLFINNGYGKLSVEYVPSGFSKIDVRNRYASINIGVNEDASYYLKGEVHYCNLIHPAGNMLNRFRANNSYRVEGNIGKNQDTSSEISITSKYGNVNLVILK